MWQCVEEDCYSSRKVRGLRTWIAMIWVAAASAAHVSAADPVLEYNRDIRPILSDACFTCHGPDSAARKGDLRLDRREDALIAAIRAGDPDKSELIARILSTDPDVVMPPPSTKKVLTSSQKEALGRWIRQGATYQPHWSLIRPIKPPLPQIEHDPWSRNPIDRFVLAELKRQGLSPAPEAGRRALARRVSLDLTGLPPAPGVVDKFVRDDREDAYERLVDHFLASPEWGEHRGRYWLDYCRFADTHGIHFDNYREMWSYRDWVIGAFNRNMPFDQFTIENLAGDLLPGRTVDQQIASGFNRCNVTTNEGGIIDEEYLVLYTRDRTETVAQVWMGLTAGCAVCHTHKFDPLTQREFYELAAFFNNTVQKAKDGNVKDTPPVIVLPLSADEDRWRVIGDEIAAAKRREKQRVEMGRAEFQAWMRATSLEQLASELGKDKQQFEASLNGDELSTAAHDKRTTVVEGVPAAKVQADENPGLRIGQDSPLVFPDAGDFDSRQPFTLKLRVMTTAEDVNAVVAHREAEDDTLRGWRLELDEGRVAFRLAHSWPKNALRAACRTPLPLNQWVNVAVTCDGSGRLDGLKFFHDGQEQPRSSIVPIETLAGTIRTTSPLTVGSASVSSPVQVSLRDLQIYEEALAPEIVRLHEQLPKLASAMGPPRADAGSVKTEDLYKWWLRTHDSEWKAAASERETLEREEADIRARGTIAHVMQEKAEPAMAFVLNRGEYDHRVEEVSPDTPDFLPAFPAGASRDRLSLARWLVQPDQPLTARVTVNRCWQEVFGSGLVRTAGDFGVMGELPSHPELLDWLAVDFVEHGWDMKRLFKQMVMSATYRQSAAATPEKLDRDPDNRLLSRAPRFRMDAEMVRDAALAASGALVRKIGGPSVKPYQPEGLWEMVGMPRSTTRKYARDDGDGLYRRSIYTFIKRMSPPPAMEIFNAPNREYCVVRRERTNTALQALVALNDEQFVEAARVLAQRAIRAAGKDTGARLNFVSSRLLSRPLRDSELKIVESSRQRLQVHYDQSPQDAAMLVAVGEFPLDDSIPTAELAAWTMLVNELMNLDEVLNK